MRVHALIVMAVGVLVAAGDPYREDLIQEDEDLDTRPVVFHAGKLPTKELPKWFMELDSDKDGQVALFEWHQAGKNIAEFLEWDRNNDGYITAEEAIYKQHLNQIASAKSKSARGDSAASLITRAGSGLKTNLGGDDRNGKRRRGGRFNKVKGACTATGTNTAACLRKSAAKPATSINRAPLLSKT